MIVVDVNLLLYAIIDGFPEHSRTREWWEATLNSTTEVGLTGPRPVKWCMNDHRVIHDYQLAWGSSGATSWSGRTA